MKQLAWGFGAAALAFGGCAQGTPTTADDFGYDGTGIQVSIAPLTLDSLSDACYSFAIENGLDQLVVARGPQSPAAGSGDNTANSVCASRFGNTAGGDISYVAPCDAQEENHTVTLWVDALCATGTGDASGWDAAAATQYGSGSGICAQIQDYVNPCGSAGCSLQVACVENADTPVTFNFTIMGQADQGFFDVAVNFDDVFCSAKLDNCNTLGEPIRLVFDDDGNRMDTVVLAVACTAGSGDVDTHLTHTELQVGCDDGAGATIGGSIPTALTEEGNFEVNNLNGAAYFGSEMLPGVNKVYSNFAFGIPEGFTCDIAWQVIPSNGPFVQPGGANTYSSFGYVNFNAKNVPQGTVECQENPLDGENSAVTTAYSTTEDDDSLVVVSHIGLGEQEIVALGDGGGGDFEPGPGDGGGSPRAGIVFLTTESGTGNIGGLAGADAACQGEAAAAGLSGTFVAWLSDSTTSAASRLSAWPVGWVLPAGGGQVAPDLATLLSDGPAVAINRHADGTVVEGDVTVWTGADADGTTVVAFSGPWTCDDWTSAEAMGAAGAVPSPSTEGWTYLDGFSCAGQRHLYCFQVATAP